MTIRRILAILAAMVMGTAAFALNPPANLTVAVSSSDVVLRWQGVAGATEYNVYKETTEITDVNALFPFATTNALTFTDNTAAGSQFYYVVTAVVPSGTISGTVIDTSAVPAQGALIYAELPGDTTVNGWAYADVNGNYEIVLPVGTYDVCIYKANRPVYTTTANVTDGGFLDLDYTFPQFARTILPASVASGNTLNLTNDQVWELPGILSVAGTLNIEEGTTITGPANVATLSFLDIESSPLGDGVGNGILNIYGEKLKPVVFTSGRLVGAPQDSDWGGIIVNGDAQNNRGRVAVGEGGTGPFGNPVGSAINNQSSGYGRYFRCEYAGFQFTPVNELNAIVFQGCGSGTDFAYYTAFGGADDGTEFFGGTNNVHHVVIINPGDDCFDWTDGWAGKAHHVVVYARGAASDKGIEADNLEADNNALPRSNGTMSNCTFVGQQGSPAVQADLLNPRRGTLFNWFNFIVTLGGSGGIDMDNSATGTSGGAGASRFDYSLFWDNGGAATEVIDGVTGAGIGDGHFRCEDAEWDLVNCVSATGFTVNGHILAAPTGWTQNISNFRGCGFVGSNATTLIADPMLADPTGYDARPIAGSQALVAANAAPAGVLAGYGLPYAPYIGAFSGPNDDWDAGWVRYP